MNRVTRRREIVAAVKDCMEAIQAGYFSGQRPDEVCKYFAIRAVPDCTMEELRQILHSMEQAGLDVAFIVDILEAANIELGDVMTIEDALMLAAKAGDVRASLLCMPSNKVALLPGAMRTLITLAAAAVERHPGWSKGEDGQLYREPDAPHTLHALVRWLEEHSPEEAALIKVRLGKNASTKIQATEQLTR